MYVYNTKYPCPRRETVSQHQKDLLVLLTTNDDDDDDDNNDERTTTTTVLVVLVMLREYCICGAFNNGGHTKVLF